MVWEFDTQDEAYAFGEKMVQRGGWMGYTVSKETSDGVTLWRVEQDNA